MKKSVIRYKIVIESAGGVKHDLSTGWLTIKGARDYMRTVQTGPDGSYIDDFGFAWDWYIEQYEITPGRSNY